MMMLYWHDRVIRALVYVVRLCSSRWHCCLLPNVTEFFSNVQFSVAVSAFFQPYIHFFHTLCRKILKQVSNRYYYLWLLPWTTLRQTAEAVNRITQPYNNFIYAARGIPFSKFDLVTAFDLFVFLRCRSAVVLDEARTCEGGQNVARFEVRVCYSKI